MSSAAGTTRKQREIQEREALILELARRILQERGYLGLNMDRLAEAAEYSKGTIYHHFTSKEDVVAGLALQAMAVRARLFQRAAAFDGVTRERIMAIGVADQVFHALYPDHARIEQICKIESIWEKASENRRELLNCEENDCKRAMVWIITDAIKAGDLHLTSNGSVTPDHILFGLWSMAWGARAIIASGLLEHKFDMTDVESVLQRNFSRLLDGYDWRPLSIMQDIPAMVERIRVEIFEDEFKELAARP